MYYQHIDGYKIRVKTKGEKTWKTKYLAILEKKNLQLKDCLKVLFGKIQKGGS